MTKRFLTPPESGKSLPVRMTTAMRIFLKTEAAGGVALFAASALAMVFANLEPEAYGRVWDTPLRFQPESVDLPASLRDWINDGAMALFFFVAGLEVKRELVRGELSDRRRAALPIFGALGGMILPAAIYLAVNPGGPTSAGWGIPTATDIAFAVGVLALLGPRVPPSLKVLLLSLAIADDLGAIAVIAFFYSDGVELVPLALAAGLLASILLARRLRLCWAPLYLVIAGGTWLAVYASGVHATVAGVALALVTPVGEVNDTTGDPIGERLEAALHPWVSFLILPLFALANAGLVINRSTIESAAGSPVTAGVLFGLVLGKVCGVTGFIVLAQKLGWVTLPDDLRRTHLLGMGALAGIGFTIALFVSTLAFDNSALEDQARVGIIGGSVISGTAGYLILRFTGSRPERPVTLWPSE